MLNVLIPQLAGFLAGLVVAYGASHGLTLNQAEVAGVFVAVWRAVELAVAAKVNPANVASGDLVQKGIAEKREVRSARARRTGNGGF